MVRCCRDSLAKILYSKMFDWLVAAINTAIGEDKDCAASVGVLDIYGFESFEYNDLEQVSALCWPDVTTCGRVCLCRHPSTACTHPLHARVVHAVKPRTDHRIRWTDGA